MKSFVYRKHRERGQAIVEFAIVLPVLLLMLLGLLEWGFLLWTQTTFSNAVREGARDAAVIRDWNVNYILRESEVRGIVINRLQSLPESQKQDISGRITIEFFPNINNIQSVRVTIAGQPYSPMIGFSSVAVPDTLTVSSEFRYEGSM